MSVTKHDGGVVSLKSTDRPRAAEYGAAYGTATGATVSKDLLQDQT